MVDDPVWTVEAIKLDLPEPNRVAAWRYGALAIDFRPMLEEDTLPFCWMISHVPTGTALVGLLTDQAKAQSAVAQLHTLHDWADAAPMEVAPAFFVAWLDSLRFDWCRSSEAINPLTDVTHQPRLRLVR
ncbi:hypothetical protein ACVOMT_13545 [Sphingomonas panni]